jgi:hypothetical protein
MRSRAIQRRAGSHGTQEPCDEQDLTLQLLPSVRILNVRCAPVCQWSGRNDQISEMRQPVNLDS